MADSSGGGAERDPGTREHVDLIPREFLRIIAVWSLVPSYAVAGGIIGYVIDQLTGWFPYVTGAGLLVALAMSVRDIYRLRDEM